MPLKVGDIVVLWGVGIRRLVVDSRDEIIPVAGPSPYRLRTVYKLAGGDLSNDWYTENQLSSVIPR